MKTSNRALTACNLALLSQLPKQNKTLVVWLTSLFRRGFCKSVVFGITNSKYMLGQCIGQVPRGGET